MHFLFGRQTVSAAEPTLAAITQMRNLNYDLALLLGSKISLSTGLRALNSHVASVYYPGQRWTKFRFNDSVYQVGFQIDTLLLVDRGTAMR